MNEFLIIFLAIVVPLIAIVLIGLVILLVVLLRDNKSATRKTQYPKAKIATFTYEPLPTTNDLKGEFGEHLVESILGENVYGEKYVINGYIYERNGKSTEIDHIVVNTRGVFVIETKNRAGDIYGSDAEEEWTQVLGDGDIVHKFRNPVLQNAAHVTKIKSILGDETPVYSLVVFVQNNTENISSDVVVPLAELTQAINRGTPKLNSRQINVIYQSLQRQRSTLTHDEHKRKLQQQNYNMIYNHICPVCGSEIVIKQSTGDKYYDCTNPKCKFTKKL